MNNANPRNLVGDEQERELTPSEKTDDASHCTRLIACLLLVPSDAEPSSRCSNSLRRLRWFRFPFPSFSDSVRPCRHDGLETIGSNIAKSEMPGLYRKAPLYRLRMPTSDRMSQRSRPTRIPAIPFLRSSRETNPSRSAFSHAGRYNRQRFTPASERSASGTVSKDGLAFLVDELHLERRAVFSSQPNAGARPSPTKC